MLNEVDKGPETFCVIFNGDISQYIIWSILYVIMYGILQPVRQIVTQSLFVKIPMLKVDTCYTSKQRAMIK